MQSPWMIMPNGKLYNRLDYDLFSIARGLDRLAKEYLVQKLQPTRYIMSESEWDDLIKYSIED